MWLLPSLAVPMEDALALPRRVVWSVAFAAGELQPLPMFGCQVRPAQSIPECTTEAQHRPCTQRTLVVAYGRCIMQMGVSARRGFANCGFQQGARVFASAGEPLIGLTMVFFLGIALSAGSTNRAQWRASAIGELFGRICWTTFFGVFPMCSPEFNRTQVCAWQARRG